MAVTVEAVAVMVVAEGTRARHSPHSPFQARTPQPSFLIHHLHTLRHLN